MIYSVFFLSFFAMAAAPSPQAKPSLMSPPFRVRVEVDKAAKHLLRGQKEKILVSVSFANHDPDDEGGSPIEQTFELESGGGAVSVPAVALGDGMTSTKKKIDTVSVQVVSARKSNPRNVLMCRPTVDIPLAELSAKTRDFEVRCSPL